jgi:hypothetical protein
MSKPAGLRLRRKKFTMEHDKVTTKTKASSAPERGRSSFVDLSNRIKDGAPGTVSFSKPQVAKTIERLVKSRGYKPLDPS